MAISDQHITIARTILAYLTWKRILKIGIGAVLSIILVLGWLSREMIFDKKPANFSKVAILKITNPVRNEIDDIVKKNDHIVAIQIVTINFQKNIRTETYVSIDSVVLQEIYNHYVNNKVIETPLFDENKVNNTRIVQLINGEFVCIPYKDTIAYKYAPDGENVVSTVCAIGIPPTYGEFTGIFTIYLKDKPTKDLTEQLFLLSREISTKIYDDNKTQDENKRQH